MSVLRFIKEWTLPVAIVTGAVIYVVFAFTPALEGAARVCGPVIDTIFPTFLFLVLFTTFCQVDFHAMRPRRWHVTVGVVQLLLLAATVIPLVWLAPRGNWLVVAECALLCLIAPCASAAPVVTAKLGGDLTGMTTYMFMSNFAVSLLIPSIFPLVDPRLEMPFLNAFLLILSRVCSILVLPMVLAFIVKHYMKWLHRRVVAIPDLSFYLWCCSIVIISGTTVRNIVHSGAPAWLIAVIAIVSLALCLAQFALGRAMGRPKGQVIEMGQGLGQKNTAFAIWVASAYLNPLSSVGPGCYILWQNFINALEIHHHQRHDK